MLPREEIAKRLDTYRNKRYDLHLKKRILLKPWIGLGKLGSLLEIFTEGRYSIDTRNKLLAEELDKLTPKKRIQFFSCFQPKLAEYFEAAWQKLIECPYTSGWTRKAFRLPHHPEHTREHRGAYIVRSLSQLSGYEEDIEWLGTWSEFVLGFYSNSVILAAALDKEDETSDKLLDIFEAAIRGEHDIAMINRHILHAMMQTSNERAWSIVEKLILNAGREEGLRQVIFEDVDFTHPKFFKRILRLVLDENLLRFSAVLRAFDCWLGLCWDSATAGKIRKDAEKVLNYLEDPQAATQALQNGTGEEVFFSLWSIAFNDAHIAIGAATPLLKEDDPEKRFAAVYLLNQLGLAPARLALIPALNDSDDRIAFWAAQAFVHHYGSDHDPAILESDAYEKLCELALRLPRKKTETKPILWPWTGLKLDKHSLGKQLIHTHGNRRYDTLIPMMPSLDARSRSEAVRILAQDYPNVAEVRDTILQLCGDPSPDVRNDAMNLIKTSTISESIAKTLEPLFKRKSESLRQALLELFLKQDDQAVLASADRLINTNDSNCKRGGKELLENMIVARRMKKKAETLLATCQDNAEQKQQGMTAKSSNKYAEYTRENALGLINPADLTPPHVPQHINVEILTEPTIQLLRELDDLVEQNKEMEIHLSFRPGRLLGGLEGWDLKYWTEECQRENQNLIDLLKQWWETRPQSTRDPDGFERVRAIGLTEESWIGETYSGSQTIEKNRLDYVRKNFRSLKKGFSYPELLGPLLNWASPMLNFANLTQSVSTNEIDFLLDILEAGFASIPKTYLLCPEESMYGNSYRVDWRSESPVSKWLSIIRDTRIFSSESWTPTQHSRFWKLIRWWTKPLPDAPRVLPKTNDVLDTYLCGMASLEDVIYLLLGPGEDETNVTGYYYFHRRSCSFYDWTRKKPSDSIKDDTPLIEAIGKCKNRIIEMELQRGDRETITTDLAHSIAYHEGIDTLINLVIAIGTGLLVRGWTTSNSSKSATFSHLIKVCFPREGETKEDFSKACKDRKIKENRLLDIALFAPQWAPFIEHTLGKPGLEDAVYWFHAHTKDDRWDVDQKIRAVWEAESSRRTPLKAEELLDGAVDVDWFNNTYKSLGAETWEYLSKNAKYASGGTGHARARLFADAMLDNVTKEDLVQRITVKRNKEAARALGLLPLEKGKKAEADILERYEILQEFLRTSKKFGSQRKASEKRAVEIGLDNLARTAGYPDPLRLQWAMETKALSDLASGAVTIKVDELEVSLLVDEEGTPELTVLKKGKKLKAIPAAAKKKHPELAELAGRKTDLKRQTSRIRQSLESSMCRGDSFTGKEMQNLASHPLLWPMISRLVLIGEGIIGYPHDGGKGLRDQAGHIEPVKATETMRVAHPHDLLESKQWHEWQRECFQAERIQPFKQVFRELYVLTPAENKETQTTRYSGHQVHPRQALALIGQRGWVHHPEEGTQKTFHSDNLSANLMFENYFTTPADVEGLTVSGVCFYPRNSYKPIPLSEVPPRVFSESMRDIDLMVSVAHRGGVDPEASQSTTEMRASLVRETTSLLGMENIRFKDNHVMVDGKLANYSIHLGSGSVHCLPGGYLCIVPVHAQHRGRLFLPFADDDPKTAEILSKTLLLARDQQIKDPSILEQIRAK